MAKYAQKCPKNCTGNKKNSSFELKWAQSQTRSVLFFTKYSLFIVDVKNGRFMYQSGRAGDEAKRRKSPAKSGRVGITGIVCQGSIICMKLLCVGLTRYPRAV